MQLDAYDFVAPAKICFGWGRRSELADLAAPLGRRAFLVCGSRTLAESGVRDELVSALESAGISVTALPVVHGEPEVADVDRIARQVRALEPDAGDFVVAIGGGSGIDFGKAIAAMATNRQGETIADYLEGVGRGLKLDATPLPLLAMPTTGGTGTEATKNAVISNYDPPYKKSLRSESLVPRVVLIDPELGTGVPPAVTAATGMDAITQLIESYISCRARPIPQALVLGALAGALEALPAAVADGGCRPARERMAHAALLSGISLANSGLGLAHGVAAALGVHARVTHGLGCAVMLPAALRANRGVREQQLAELAAVLLGKPFANAAAAADALVDRIEQLCDQVEILHRLSQLGVGREQLPAIVQCSRGNSMNGNPRTVDDQELLALLEEML